MESAKRPRPLAALAFLAVLALAIYLRANISNSGAAGRVFMRNDENHYLKLVVAFLNGDWNVEYFVNPTLLMYVLYGATVLFGGAAILLGYYGSWGEFVLDATMDPFVITIVGRWLSFGLGVASVALLYLIGKRLYSARAGWVAAFALAVDRVHIDRGSLVGNEVLMVFLLLVFFLALLSYIERPTWKRQALCGVLLGLAASAKYNAGIHVVTLAVATWIAARRDEPDSAPMRRLAQPRSLVAFPLAGLFFWIGSPFVLINFSDFREDFLFQASLLHGGYGPPSVGWTYYPLRFVFSIGRDLALLCAVGVAMAVVDAVARREWRAGLVLSAILPTYLVLGSGIFSWMRFFLPAIPFVLLLGGRALDRILGWLLDRGAPGSERTRAWKALAAVAAILAVATPQALATDRALDGTLRRVDHRAELLDWMVDNIDPQGRYLHVIPTPTSKFFPISSDIARIRSSDLHTRAERELYRRQRERTFRSRPLRSVLRGVDTFEGFQQRLAEIEETHLILSLWSPRRMPRNPDLDKEMTRMLLGRRPFQECTYWKEAVAYLTELEVTGYIVGRGRHDLVCVVELP